MDYHALLQSSVAEPERFWADQARRIEWHTPWTQVLDTSRAPHSAWFVGGLTNLCHNAVDRHLDTRGDQAALRYVSTDTNEECAYTYRDLHREVSAMAAIFLALGVRRGDRVLIYLPMIPQATFAMLACARIGAVHSVVFGGFAAASLAARIDDAQPALVVTADAGFQNGKAVAYRPLVAEAMRLAGTSAPVLHIDRGIVEAVGESAGGEPAVDADYTTLRAAHIGAEVPCTWLESNEPSYILYTSGTTGKPKGVQRDVGGYAVALATTMHYLFGARAGDTLFTTSDLGWVVGHSYGVYAPLICGLTTVMMEGTPLRPDSGIWWRLVERYRVDLMLSAPTAMRLLKRQDTQVRHHADLSSLRALFLAGEPLDEPTSAWAQQALGVPVVDHYWQTESGWPMLGLPVADTDGTPMVRTPGSPGLPTFGFRLKLVDETYGLPCLAGEKGLLVADGPLPPGCFTTLWNHDDDFRRIYWSRVDEAWRYATFDWGRADIDGQVRVLGRADDVMIVAGKRIGTREIEEVLLAHAGVAEAAVVGVPSVLRGQVPIAFVVAGPATAGTEGGLEAELIRTVSERLGKLARPRRVILVKALPRTRSGKVLRRLMQGAMAALAQGAAAPTGDIAAAIDELVRAPDVGAVAVPLASTLVATFHPVLRRELRP